MYLCFNSTLQYLLDTVVNWLCCLFYAMATTSSIKRVYSNKNLRGAFTGFPAFVKARKYKDFKKVKEALQELESYTLHKRVLKKIPRRVTRVFFANYQWSIDLMSTQNVAKYNRGINYVMVIICNFSKFLITKNLKSKSAIDVETALASVLKKAKTRPKFILVDDGKVSTLNKGYCVFFIFHNIPTFKFFYLTRNSLTRVSKSYVLITGYDSSVYIRT